jgi:methionyl-tRNA formyltransferase
MKPAMKNSIIFMGTPEFAIPTLCKLNEFYEVKAVVTVPDKPQGRGLKLIPSPVKVKAEELGLKVLQPEKLKDEEFINEINELNPDIICVLAFRILPKEVYQIPKYGTFNIHASLLPKLRGAAPINWAIINGEKTTGLTSFLLQEKVDTGDVLLRREVKITEEMTAGDLHDLLMPISADLSIETCEMLLSENYSALPQNNELATAAPKLFADKCHINWETDSITLRNFIHGTSPVPCSWTTWDNKKLKIFKVKDKATNTNLNPGEFTINNNSFLVGTGNNTSLELLEIQLEGKKAMQTVDFLRGFRGETKGKLI